VPDSLNNGEFNNDQVNSLTLLESALSYAARGWLVFPLAVRSKKPRLGSRGFLDASADPERIRAWWAEMPDANIGIRTGPESGLLVIDTDPKHDGIANFKKLQLENGSAKGGLASRTGSGGYHAIYRYPTEGAVIGCSAGIIRPGVDVRADGGYIVAPPSIHPNGTRYQWHQGYGPDDLPLIDAPDWLVKLCREASSGGAMPGGSVAVGDGHRPDKAEKIQRLFLQEVPEGIRNASATAVAGYLFQHLDPAIAWVILQWWDQERGHLDKGELQTVRRSITRREMRKLRLDDEQ
jgi:hypothetical protein